MHSQGTGHTARRFAEVFGAEPHLAELAGWYHDSAKDLPLHISQQLPYTNGLKPDRYELHHKGLIHGPASATIASEYMGIDNRGVLEAIRYHVTGRPSPTSLEKALYLADICEPNRDFEEFEFLHEIARDNAELAVVVWIGIKYVLVERLGRKPHHRTRKTLTSFATDLKKQAAEIISERGLGELSL
ncbi:MAG: HD domain-containing protein [bacterium]|nr:HD domain-containing protein [bacterium]